MAEPGFLYRFYMMHLDIDELMSEKGSVICRLPGQRKWGVFAEPVKIINCSVSGEVASALAELETALNAGYYAAGFMSYEAGAAFDEAFPRYENIGFPLLWFAVYDEAPEIYEPCGQEIFAAPGKLLPELSDEAYHEAVKNILTDIEAGNLYQTNFTFRLRGDKIRDPWYLFKALFLKHPVPYAAFVNTGDSQIVSLSPELFLERNADKIFSRPMKGTVKRDEDPAKDKSNMEFLGSDPKNIAENLMIVDMVRNDLGRVCHAGSIFVEPLFKVDEYKTLHQMTSTVHGEVSPETTFTDIIRAAFPAASITGAPKIAAMRKIRELEKSPRKIYTGSIGCVFPNRDFCMNVAIRTLICDNGATELGVGGGIVYDSGRAAELEEAMLKSEFVNAARPDFEILETMLFEPGTSIVDLNKHLERMKKSAEYFSFKYPENRIPDFIREKLVRLDSLSRIRFLLSFDGSLRLEAFALRESGWGAPKAKIRLSEKPISSADVFLRHKTTRRDFYNENFRRALADGYDEVVFFNERGELCEGAISNIFIKSDNGLWYTPSLSSGLLPGIWREKTIAELKAVEKVLYRPDLENADEILIGNSVRGAVRAQIVNDITIPDQQNFLRSY